MLQLRPYTYLPAKEAAASKYPELNQWRAPDEVTDHYDLRSLPQCAAEGGDPGFGLMQSDKDLGGVSLGKDLDTILAPATVDGVNKTLGISLLTKSPTAREIVKELQIHADHTGQDRWKPWLPDKSGVVSVSLGGTEISRTEFLKSSAEERTPVVSLLQKQYADYRNVSVEKARECLSLMTMDYGLTREMIQGKFVKDGRQLKPRTQLNDTFNRADQTGLGTSSEGWVWAAVVAGLNIVSNQADCLIGANASSRAESDLSSANHWAIITIVNAASWSSGTYGGPLVRFDAAAQTYFWLLVYNSTVQWYKNIGGVTTALGAATTVTFANNDVWKGLVDGSNNLTGYQNGTSRVTTNDGSITGNLRTGLGAFGSVTVNAIFDTFQADDGASGFIPAWAVAANKIVGNAIAS